MNREEYAIMFNVEDRHWWYAGLRGMLGECWRRHIRTEHPRVLDVGCGTGAVLDWLTPHSRYGIDLCLDAIQFCRSRKQETTAVASANELPFPPETFDVAVCLDVLYHKGVPDRNAALRAIRQVLVPNGVVLINVPAYQWLYSSHDVAVHTDHRFTKREMLRLLTENGFEPLEATYWNTLLFPPILLTRLWHKISPPSQSDLSGGADGISHGVFSSILALERHLIRLTPMPFGLSIFVAARKSCARSAG